MRWFEDVSCLIMWICFQRRSILGLTWLFIILWSFYFSSKCQNNFGPFSDFLKNMSVYVKVLNTLDWSHNHFFWLSDHWCVHFQVKNKLSPTTLFIFFDIFYFLELGWDFLYFWGCMETIHLCASFFSILKIMGSSRWKRACHKISFFHFKRRP